MATLDYSKLTDPELLKKIKLVKVLFGVFIGMMLLLIGISLYMILVEKKSITSLVAGIVFLVTIPMNVKNIRALESERAKRGI
jgi:multisubunit Na+/H+ antiporter MnhG subunit